jgi:hypothetical protein
MAKVTNVTVGSTEELSRVGVDEEGLHRRPCGRMPRAIPLHST